VRVEAGAVHECEVRAWRGLFVRGTVVRPDGGPAVRAHVFGFDLASDAFVDARTDEAGRFALGPLSPGSYQLEAMGGPEHVSSESVEARPGATDVRLVLREGARIAGRVLGAPGGTQKIGFTLAPSQQTGNLRTGDLVLASNGTFSVGPVEPGGYDLTVFGPGGTVAQARDLQLVAGSRSLDLTLALERGGTIRLRYRGIEPYAQLAIHAGGALVARDGVRQGTEEMRTVPPGDVRVVLTDQAERTAEREVRVEAGAIVEVEIELE
jgi:hypothetical protein